MLKLKKYSGGEQVVQILKENWEKNLTEKWDPRLTPAVYQCLGM